MASSRKSAVTIEVFCAVVGEKLSNVRLTNRSEYGVGDGVHQNVGITMSHGMKITINPEVANLQDPPLSIRWVSNPRPIRIAGSL